MSDLTKIMSKMRPTGSSTNDFISIKNIKQAARPIYPLLLNLINATIRTMIYPSNTKTAKIKPVPKDINNLFETLSRRPINIIQSFSKIIESVLLIQIIEHLASNHLIHQNHHGALKNKSTQTAIIKLYDILIEVLETGQEAALIIIDQSKAYKNLPHKLLLEKLKIAGFSRRQTVQVM